MPPAGRALVWRESQRHFAIDRCIIGPCRAGGISARKHVEQLTVAGFNENRVQRDAHDTDFMGYSEDAHGGAGQQCGCSVMKLFGEPKAVKWDDKGRGQWRELGVA